MKREAEEIIAPPLRTPSREELEDADDDGDDAPAENPGRPVKGRPEVSDLRLHVGPQVGDPGFNFADPVIDLHFDLQQVFLGRQVLGYRKIGNGSAGGFLRCAEFFQRVVHSDVNVAAHDVIILQFVSRLKFEFAIVCFLLLTLKGLIFIAHP